MAELIILIMTLITHSSDDIVKKDHQCEVWGVILLILI